MNIQWIGIINNVASVNELHKINYLVERIGNSIRWHSFNSDLFGILTNKDGTLLFIKIDDDFNAYELTKRISINYPLVSTILIAFEQDYDLKKALRAGARDIISISQSEEEIIEAVQEANRSIKLKLERYNVATPVESSRNGKIITVGSMKGGVGKTTISINLAVALAKSGLKTAVVDMDLQSGDVAILLDIKPKVSIYDWVKADSKTQEEISQFMLKHDSGVEIIAAPLRPELAEKITGRHIKNLLETLKKLYDVIIIDTPPHLLENEIVILENSDEILVVINKELPTLKNSKIYIETLESIGFQNKLKVLLNRDAKVAGLQKGTVENILSHSISHTIPNEEKIVITSINKGIPFVISNTNSKVAGSIFLLAGKLNITLKTDGKNKKRSFFKKVISGGR